MCLTFPSSVKKWYFCMHFEYYCSVFACQISNLEMYFKFFYTFKKLHLKSNYTRKIENKVVHTENVLLVSLGVSCLVLGFLSLLFVNSYYGEIKHTMKGSVSCFPWVSVSSINKDKTGNLFPLPCAGKTRNVRL